MQVVAHVWRGNYHAQAVCVTRVCMYVFQAHLKLDCMSHVWACIGSVYTQSEALAVQT